MRIIVFLFSILVSVSLSAYINPELYEAPPQGQSGDQEIDYRMDCAQATNSIDMDVNNVRARLLSGGDVWWDLEQGRYIVPAVEPGSGQEPVSSIFAGAVWLGGFDQGGNLKMACQTYRSNTANDFWPGPLDPENGQVNADICRNWDLFFEVQGAEIERHRANYNQALVQGTLPLDEDLIPRGVLCWPGRGNDYFEECYGFRLPDTGQGLGAFLDRDEDGNYEPEEGDFPIIEIRGCDVVAFPDEMIFWIYNDNGGVHTNTQGDPIQMEVQVQTFAFESNDELNDMTFQRYKLINRATEDIDSTFFAMWVDPDLGCYTDDYVGCDVGRSLAYVYNEDAVDGEVGSDCFGVNTYGSKVPILGVDYFRGPLDFDQLDTIFDDEGNIIDFTPRELGMSSFTYYNNGGIGTPDPGTTDPQVDFEFYNYLSGSWRDGTPFTFGGDAYNPGSTDEIDYAFVDPPNLTTGWSMCSEQLPFGDRRTIQASGPFRLAPGVVNELIIGVPWISELDYPCPDITALLRADDLAQNLFDNCFQIVNGPDAPDVDIVELDEELILVLSNDEISSNNAFEEYEEVDIFAPNDVPEEEKLLKFEGYKVFQLARNEEVSVDDINEIDPAQARLIYEADLKNNVEMIYNWEPQIDPTGETTETVWIPSVQSQGLNQGIRKTIRVTEDQFASSDRSLVNFRQYYFIAIAYGHNEYEPFNIETGLGQRRPYIVGRRNRSIVKGTPRPILYDNLNSQFGDGPIITRLDGQGVADRFVRVSKEQREAFLDPDFNGEITYLPGQGPIEVSVFNPFVIQDGEYLLEFKDSDNEDQTLDADTEWTITELSTGEVFDPQKSIETSSDEILGDLGFSVFISQSDEVGTGEAENNGAIGFMASYEDIDGTQWYAGIGDDPPAPGNLFNFIKTAPNEEDNPLDLNQNLSNLGNSSWNPYFLADFRRTQNPPNPPVMITPALIDGTISTLVRQRSDLSDLNNVDIVFTSDKSKWSRCIVVETGSTYYTDDLNKETQGISEHFDLRDAPSVGLEDNDGDGVADPDGDGRGMSWFPGYAVDVETGQRLNIFFGENSTYSENDGRFFPDGNVYTRDMMFNPSSDLFIQDPRDPTITLEDFITGGQHFIYVTKQPYDECADLRSKLDPDVFDLQKTRALPEITWTSLPMLAEGAEWLSYADGLIPNDYTVELRVNNPYDVSFDEDDNGLGTGENGFHPSYRFTFDGVTAEALTEAQRSSVLDNVVVTPNPYYAFSSYETEESRRIVRISNLPPQATVTIYSLDGRFIRQYERDVQGQSNAGRTNPGIPQAQETPYLEWDLENARGIPVAAGVYLIHVSAPNLGERVIKWFGINRKFDPSTLQ